MRPREIRVDDFLGNTGDVVGDVFNFDGIVACVPDHVLGVVVSVPRLSDTADTDDVTGMFGKLQPAVMHDISAKGVPIVGYDMQIVRVSDKTESLLYRFKDPAPVGLRRFKIVSPCRIRRKTVDKTALGGNPDKVQLGDIRLGVIR